MSIPLNPDSLLATLRRLEPDCFRFLEAMVRTNSYTGNAAGVNTNADLIVKQFTGWGLSEQRVQCQDTGTGKHLILDSGGDGPVIACISHLDTVFPEEEEIRNQFSWTIDGDRAYGPGTFDIKGGTAIIWLMLAALREELPDVWKRFRWVLIWNAAEERLTQDFAPLCLKTLPANTQACLVFEGDSRGYGEGGVDLKQSKHRFIILESRKGLAKFHIKVQGRGAHAGSSHTAGANAIQEIARIICQLQNMTDYSKDLTVNVGKVLADGAFNRVPHEAEAWLEMRAYDPDVFYGARDQILAFTGKGEVHATSDRFHCQIEVEDQGGMPPWGITQGTLGLIEKWREAAAQLGYEFDSGRRGGVSDANPLVDHFPTLDGLGPCGGNSHVSERSADGTKVPEYIDMTSFVPKALLNITALANIARQ